MSQISQTNGFANILVTKKISMLKLKIVNTQSSNRNNIFN